MTRWTQVPVGSLAVGDIVATVLGPDGAQVTRIDRRAGATVELQLLNLNTEPPGRFSLVVTDRAAFDRKDPTP